MGKGFLDYKSSPEKKQDPEHLLEVVPRFQDQAQPDNCEPTCFKNILDELACRNGQDRLRRSIASLNRMFQYKRGRGYCDSDVGIFNLNSSLLPLGFTVLKISGPRSGFGRLESVILDATRSFPIVAVNPSYFAEQLGAYRVVGDPRIDHALIMLRIDHEKETVMFFDPYENYLKAKGVKDIKTQLASVRFNSHWEHASRPYWMAWVEPETKPIEGFGKEGT